MAKERPQHARISEEMHSKSCGETSACRAAISRLLRDVCQQGLEVLGIRTPVSLSHTR